jgi:hypothetical protein
MGDDRLFWAYANLVFEALVVFILPLAFAAYELARLRRDRERSPAPDPGAGSGRRPWYMRPRPPPWSPRP